MHWWEVSKQSLTGLRAGNAPGYKLPMFTIFKANKPRCLKNFETFSLTSTALMNMNYFIRYYQVIPSGARKKLDAQ